MTNVEGSTKKISWFAMPAVNGVVVNGPQDAYEGGTNGTIQNGVNHEGAIKRVVFCGCNNEIPEFGLLAAGLVMTAGIGLVIWRRR